MQGSVVIIAASALLSAGLVGGLAAPVQTPPGRVDPPTRAGAGPACGAGSWPYAPTVCAPGSPSRKVRLIALDGPAAPVRR